MIAVEQVEGYRVVTLDRADKRNALNSALCDAIRGAVEDAVTDRQRALVITGAGSSFCAGADFSEVYSEGFLTALYGMLDTVVHAPLVVIAAVNGPAIGGGTQLALAADLRIAAPEAVFGIPAARLGLAVDPWTVRRLALLAGNGTARRVLLTCDTLDAAEAHTVGLVERLGSPADARQWAAEAASAAPLTVRYSKKVLNASLEPDLDRDSAPELFTAFDGCWNSADFAEGRTARLEKRPPRFEGR